MNRRPPAVDVAHLHVQPRSLLAHSSIEIRSVQCDASTDSKAAADVENSRADVGASSPTEVVLHQHAATSPNNAAVFSTQCCVSADKLKRVLW